MTRAPSILTVTMVVVSTAVIAFAGQAPAGSPLKGLTRLGIVVEGLGGSAASCGLKQETPESALARQLTAP